MTSTGSESDTESSVTDCSASSDTESESDYSVGKPEPENGVEVVGAGDEDSENLSPSPVCLLCPVQVPMEELWTHLKIRHDFDIFGLRQKFKMDQLAFIKLVNFVRKEASEVCESSGGMSADSVAKLVSKISTCSSALWDSEKYLHPMMEEDPVLTYWFDETDEDQNIEAAMNGVKDFSTSNSENLCLESVLEENVQLLQRNKEYERALAEAYENMKLMKEVMNRICGDDLKTTKNLVLKRYNEALSKHNLDYFESYDDLQIHATMINDTQRTEAYRSAILNNAVDFKDKIVLDVGCGTSILSMFAAKAGASKVFAVDRSNILDKAVQIVRENELQNIIDCIKGTVETINLPVEKVDILISEFMGYFLLFEGMLASYIDARKKFLRPGGVMYPNTAEILIAGISEMEKFEENSKMWDNVYGFKMSALKVPRKVSPIIEAVKPEKCVTNASKILSLDLMTCEYDDASFQTDFSLTVTEEKSITGIVGYFDVGFTTGSVFQNTLSTGPHLPETHWYQTTFPLSQPLVVKKGDVIPGVFECRPNLQNPRSLDITLTIGGERHTYLLD